MTPRINTGVMVQHLGRMRTADWSTRLIRAANEGGRLPEAFRFCALAEQDVINWALRNTGAEAEAAISDYYTTGDAVRSEVQVQVSFENRRTADVLVNWEGAERKLVPIRELASGDTAAVDSFDGHSFVITEKASGRLIQRHVVRKGGGIAVISVRDVEGGVGTGTGSDSILQLLPCAWNRQPSDDDSIDSIVAKNGSVAWVTKCEDGYNHYGCVCGESLQLIHLCGGSKYSMQGTETLALWANEEWAGNAQSVKGVYYQGKHPRWREEQEQEQEEQTKKLAANNRPGVGEAVGGCGGDRKCLGKNASAKQRRKKRVRVKL
jgi:hypothetical protein